MREGYIRELAGGISLEELYPEGRTLYCEDDDPAAFLALARELGLEITLTADIPADKLEAFYARTERDGMRVGS